MILPMQTRTAVAFNKKQSFILCIQGEDTPL